MTKRLTFKRGRAGVMAASALAAGLALATATDGALAHGMGAPGQGAGGAYGPCPDMMGMHRGYGMAPGMMGPGMMGMHRGYGMAPGMMGMHGQGGYGMGPGMMGPGMAPGMMGPQGRSGMMAPGMVAPERPDLGVDDAKAWLERWLAMSGNPRLALGAVDEKDDDAIVAEIVTKDGGALVDRIEIDRHSGAMRRVD